MRRVAYVFPWGEMGGAEIATLRLLEAHDRERYEPVAFLLTGGPLADRLTSSGVEVRVAPSRPRLSKASERREARQWIATYLKTDNIAIQHDVLSWTHALAGPAARAAGIPVLWYQHNRPDVRSVIDWWAAWNDTAVIITNSLFTAGRQRWMNIRRRPIEVLYYPPISLPNMRQPREAVRRELGTSDEDVLVLLPARMQRWKGQDVAIRALARAIRGAPQLRLVLAGGSLFGLEPTYPEELERLAANLRVSKQIQFLGQVEDMAPLYDACDIMLHTSRHPEPYGLVVAEAKVHGKAIIASNAGAIPEQIEDGQTGLLVPPENDRALADALEHLSRNPSLRRTLGKAAAESQRASPRQATEQLEGLYDRVLGANACV